jgi:uncharacterized membrane protein
MKQGTPPMRPAAASADGAPRAARWVDLAILAASVGYPFAIHGTRDGQARWVMLALAALWMMRAVAARPRLPAARLLAAIAAAFCVASAIGDAMGRASGATASAEGVDATQWAHWYPVAVNAALCAMFAISLLRGMPVIERVARAATPELPATAIAYTRNVTIMWAAFFALNGAIAALLVVTARWNWWALYNGVISYVLIAALIGAEWLVRPAQWRGSPPTRRPLA